MEEFFIVIGTLIILALYILAIVWFFKNAAVYVLSIGSAAYFLLILVNYIRAIIDCFSKQLSTSKNEKPSPPEPAYKNYFFKKAYFDYLDIIKRAWSLNWEHSVTLFFLNLQVIANPGWFITWPIGVTLFAVFFIAAVSAIITFISFGLLHLIIISFICLVAYVVAFYFLSIEWLSMLWRQISYKCPHPECYKPIQIPIYICPSCGAQHKKLIPGSYGIFKRRCSCGHEKLPTLLLFGRRKLESICPHPNCNKPLNSAIGSSRNIHIPIIGGPSSGKTNYLIACISEIVQANLKSYRTIEFPDVNDRKTYKYFNRLFCLGQPALKTAELSPKSFMLKITEKNGERNLLYIYDPAGELYGDSEDVRLRHEYFSYIDGILFLIDPFSLKQIQMNFKKRIEQFYKLLKPCNESPHDVYDRFITTLQEFIPNNNTRKKIPIAIIITKIDALRFITKEPFSIKSRNWLINTGQGNLVRCFENDFDNVIYSRCSSFGHMPQKNKPFRPFKILPPLQWLLRKKSIQIKETNKDSFSWRSEKIAYIFSFAIVSIIFFLFISFAFNSFNTKININLSSLPGKLFNRQLTNNSTQSEKINHITKKTFVSKYVQEAYVCTNVINRVPKEISNTYKSYQKYVNCWSNIVNYNGNYIQHAYYCNGNLIRNIRLEIGNNVRFRTWSRKQIWVGNWVVKILNNNNQIMAELRFKVIQ
jgi:hypothetical protein